MDWLETFKKVNKENETITNDVVAQAHLENYALKLFQYADKNDREGNFNKNIVKAFFSAGKLYDVIETFGELSVEAVQNRKYANWKAAYIHNCLKNGETPIPGPLATEGDDEFNEGGEVSPSQPGPGPNIGFTNPSPPSYDGAFGGPVTSDTSDFDPLNIRAPSPPKDEEKSPGGFKAYMPTSPQEETCPADTVASSTALTPELTIKAQKYCKWAGSALNYDDVPSAIENLQNALRLLQTGRDG